MRNKIHFIDVNLRIGWDKPYRVDFQREGEALSTFYFPTPASLRRALRVLAGKPAIEKMDSEECGK